MVPQGMTPEARILLLAEKATPGSWASDDKGVFTADGAGPICWVGDAYPRGDNHPTENMAYIAALGTHGEAMARVVEAARRLKEDEDYVPIAMMARWSGLYAALAALDAEGEK